MSNKPDGVPIEANYQWNLGITMRDYFAAKATISMDAATNSLDWERLKTPRAGFSIEIIFAEQARLAYVYADAMLKAREL